MHRTRDTWCIENPHRSTLALPEVIALLGLRGAMDKHFSQCMHSRDPIRRNKVTKLRHVVLELEQWGIECDGSHDHAPWGIS
jgi:hypothetical protein